MKAITLLEPWATLIALGAKRIETRSWSTKYRGPLAIHASKSCKAGHMDIAWKEPFYSALSEVRILHRGHPAFRYHLGCVIAVCRLIDCMLIDAEEKPPEPEASFGDYTPGRYAWLLADVRMIPPAPAKGRLGLWEWEAPTP